MNSASVAITLAYVRCRLSREISRILRDADQKRLPRSPPNCGSFVCWLPRSCCSGRSRRLAWRQDAGAFYYPWYPATWTVNGAHVAYHPLLGYYSSSSLRVVDRHVRTLNYAKVDVAIASWFGPGSQSEATRIPLLLRRTVAPAEVGAVLRMRGQLAERIELSGRRTGSGRRGDPEGSRLRKRVHGLARLFARERQAPGVRVERGGLFLRGGRSLEAGRTRLVRRAEAVIGLQGTAPISPTPGTSTRRLRRPSTTRATTYSISPGFRRADGAGSVLRRSVRRWRRQVRQMVASREPWQLITTFNEWGEGTAVEPAREWRSRTGYGKYLDALHKTR